MATTPRDMLIEALHPGVFRGEEDVEAFIQRSTRYFDASGIQKPMRTILVIGLIAKELRDKYEATEKLGKSFEDRIRAAFTKKRTLAQEVEAAFQYRRRKEDTDGYVKKIDALVDNLLKHKWNKETLTMELMTHCCNDREVLREIKMQECDTAQKVEQIIRRFDKVREETEPIEAIRSYRDVVTKDRRPQTLYPRGREAQDRNEPIRREMIRREPTQRDPIRREITCWTCGEIGHINRQCPRRARRCFECGSEDHIKRDCNKVKCFRCNLTGHRQYECQTRGRQSSPTRRYPERTGQERQGEYRRHYYQERRPHQSQINAIGEEEAGYSKAGDGYRHIGDVDAREEDNEGYPNGTAPSEAELIGAINRI